MRRIASFACLAIVPMAVFLSPSAASAQSDPMAGYYGNTLILRNDKGLEVHMWYYPDGRMVSFSKMVRDGQTAISGSETNWEVQGDRLCRINKNANPPTNSCTASTLNSGELGHKVGDKWDNVARNGDPEHFEVVAGHR